MAPCLGKEVEQVAEGHEKGYAAIGGEPLRKDTGVELREYLGKNVVGRLEVLGTEKYPKGGDEVESYNGIRNEE